MGYRGGRLAPWFDSTGTTETAKKMAEDGGKRMTELAGSYSPVKTGLLWQSWKKSMLTTISMGIDVLYQSGTETDVEYAPYVEFGTGLWGPKHATYVIRPKKPGGVLHFFAKDGTEVFTTLVIHPGSPGQHMVAHAVQDLEVALPVISEVWLLEWAQKTEKQNHTGLAI